MKKISWTEKLCYGLSSVGGNLPNYLIIGYLTLFATDVMGLSAASAGMVVMVCSIFDAITDLFVTNIADRTHTRWGKYRPWLLFTGIPMTITLVLLFWYPSFLVTARAKLIWLFVGYFLLSPVFLTGYLCPQYVMLSVITDDEDERLSLGSARSIGEFISDLLVNGLCMTIVLWLGSGSYREPGSWRGAITFFAVISFICCLSGFLGTRERVHISNQDLDGRTLTMKEKLHLLLHSRMFGKVLVLNAGVMLATVESVLFSYFCIYSLGHEEWLSALSTIASLASIAVTALLPSMGNRIGKQAAIFIGGFSLIAATLCCIFARSFPGALLFVTFKGIGYGLCISCCGVLWATTSDHIEAKTGIAIPGLVMAAGSFASKILMGLCTFLGTQILTLGGYQEMQAVQSARTLNWIRYGMAGFLLLAAVIILISNRALRDLYQFEK